MKKLIALFLFTLVISTSCKKSDDNTNSEIVGEWVSTESLADPGNGSGTWRSITDDQRTILVIKSNGKITGSTTYKSYKVIDGQTIELKAIDGDLFQRSYTIVGNQLTIMGGCIEACGLRYTKTK